MLGLRQKISFGFGGLLVIIGIIGTQSILSLSTLGQSIDVILRENYRSVVACQEMKEALERIDSGSLFSFAGRAGEGQELIDENVRRFEKSLAAELGNITMPGEGEKAGRIQELFALYKETIPEVTNTSLPLEARRATYFDAALPL